MIQVDPTHYSFNSYMTKERWVSVWYQLYEILEQNPQHVLEIGPGPGILKKIGEVYGLRITTLDWDHSLNPDCVGNAEQLPIADASFDVVVSFQMLEHLPYKRALKVVGEIARVTKKAVIISLPDCRTRWMLSARLPIIGKLKWSITPPKLPKQHVFDGEHYWEIGKKGYQERQIVKDFEYRSLMLKDTYRVDANPYHHFFIFSAKK